MNSDDGPEVLSDIENSQRRMCKVRGAVSALFTCEPTLLYPGIPTLLFHGILFSI
jgi:hypothetical protein